MNLKNKLRYARAIALTAEGILAAGSALDHEQVALANETQFVESYFSQPLTAYAVGWRDPRNIQATLDFVAPAVVVPRRFDYAMFTNSEEFLADSQEDLKRAINSDFKVVKDYTETKVHAETENKGLTMLIDLDRVAEKTGWQERYTEKLLRRISRSDLREAVALLGAAAINTGRTWDTTAGKDPDHDVDTSLNAGETASGIRPIRTIYGETAWTKRRLAFRAQNNAAGYASAGLSEKDVAAYLGLEGLMVSHERYQSGAAAKSEILNNLVLSFYATDGLDPEDPSNIKRFTSPIPGAGNYRVYAQQISAKIFQLTVETYNLIKITSSLGIRKETIS